MSAVKQLELTIFAKKMQSTDGKTFYRYLTTLPNSEEKVSVKFREEAGNPKDCPCNIIIKKGDCNLAPRKYSVEVVNKETGEVTEEIRESKVLWVSKWAKSENVYEDTSMDEYFN